MAGKLYVLADDPSADRTAGVAQSVNVPLLCNDGAGYVQSLQDNHRSSLQDNHAVSLRDNHRATLRDNHAMSLQDDIGGTLGITEGLKSGAARSPISIAAGIGAGALAGYRLHKSASKRFGKGKKSIALAAAGGAVTGIVAHGVASLLLYKYGGSW